MAKLDTKRRIRFNDRFNFSDVDTDLGFMLINGEVKFPNSKISVTVKFYDPSSDKQKQTDSDNFEWNEEVGQIFVFT